MLIMLCSYRHHDLEHATDNENYHDNEKYDVNHTEAIATLNLFFTKPQPSVLTRVSGALGRPFSAAGARPFSAARFHGGH